MDRSSAKATSSARGCVLLEPSNHDRRLTDRPWKTPGLRMPVLLSEAPGRPAPPAKAKDTMRCMSLNWDSLELVPYCFVA